MFLMSKDMEDSHYFCPDCKAKLNLESSDTEKKHSESRYAYALMELFDIQFIIYTLSIWRITGFS